MSRRPVRVIRDVRFVIGVVLVIVAVAGVWGVVASARTTAPVWMATRTIVPGETLRAGDLRSVDVGLGDVAATYLASDGAAPAGVAVTVIEAGQLVPVSAVGTADDARLTTVVVTSAGPVTSAVEVGRSVELWATEVGRDDEPRPHLVVADAIVAEIEQDGGGVVSRGTSVELLVPPATVPDILRAQSSGAVLAVVPTAGAG